MNEAFLAGTDQLEAPLTPATTLYDEHGHLARKTQHETRTNEVNARRTRLVLGWATVFGRVYHLGM